MSCGDIGKDIRLKCEMRCGILGGRKALKSGCRSAGSEG